MLSYAMLSQALMIQLKSERKYNMAKKSIENRLRRLLASKGYALRKSRLDPYKYGGLYGGYMIISTYNNTIEAGESFDLSLDDVEQFVS